MAYSIPCSRRPADPSPAFLADEIASRLREKPGYNKMNIAVVPEVAKSQ
jgi:hypothetical protein